MRNTLKHFGTQYRILCAITLLVVTAFSMAACDSGFGGDGGAGTDSSLNGTWVDNRGITIIFNNGNCEERANGVPYIKGTYTTNGNSLTMRITHVAGELLLATGWNNAVPGKWYTETELLAAGVPEGYGFGDTFKPQTVTYSVSGNTLYLISGGETSVLYRR